jgi:hypothetical protein
MQTTFIQSKNCLSCTKQLRGRTDKKFCNDYCRNSYNNQLKAPVNNLIRNINHVLAKNRRILESFLAEDEEMIKVKKEKLMERGYLSKYATHIYINKKGSIYYYCYDYGVLSLDESSCVIVKSKEEWS